MLSAFLRSEHGYPAVPLARQPVHQRFVRPGPLVLRTGSLRLVGNQPLSAIAKGSLTVRPTSRAGTKVGYSDPVVLHGRAIAHRIKVTIGITGLSPPRVHIDGEVWHLDVGSSHPGAVVRSKGWAVRPLKRHASWVQNVVRQFGPYPVYAQEI